MGSMISKLIPARKMLTFMALGVLALSILASFALAQPASAEASAFNMAVDQVNEAKVVAKPKKDTDAFKYFSCIANFIEAWGDVPLKTLLAIIVFCDCLYIEKSEPGACSANFQLAIGVAQPASAAENPKQGNGKLKQVDFEDSQVVAETSTADSPEPTILEDTLVTFQDSQVVMETSTADSPELTIAEDPLVTTFVVSP